MYCSSIYQVRTGYDGLGGRAKFIQPVSLCSENYYIAEVIEVVSGIQHLVRLFLCSYIPLTAVHQSPLSEIRPLAMKPKRKKVTRPVTNKPTSTLTTLDSFLE